ncbi:hypothetical protein C7N43_25000 [Sphingobacteriales bacterium UPWRP_1]|nr:hypothetical protein C7N43_25000 [Sphingobacteriales bacterium UPWRP_1]
MNLCAKGVTLHAIFQKSESAMAVIEKIRQRVGLVVFLIAAAIVAFLLMDALNTTSRMAGNSPVIGAVDGEKIDYQNYQAKIEQITDNYQNNQMEITDETRMQIREQAWNQEVEETLLRRAYDALGISITKEEMESLFTGDNLHASIKSAAAFQDENGQFSRDKLAQYVKSFTDGTEEGKARQRQWKRFEESVLKDELKQKYTNLIKKAVYVPSWYAKEVYVDKNKKANVNYVFVPYTTIQDTEVSFTDSDLKAYLNKNKEKFKQKDSKTIEYLTFDVIPTAEDSAAARKTVADNLEPFKTSEDAGRFVKIQNSDTPFSDKYMKKDEVSGAVKDSLFSVATGTVIGPYYEAGAYKLVKLIDRKMIADSVKVRQIIKIASDQASATKAKTTIDSLKTVLEKGGDFAALAAQFSDDPTTKDKGGDMGYVKPDAINPDLAKAIFYEHKKGDIFTVPTQQGLYLVQITEANPNAEAVKFATFSKNVEPSEQTRNAAFAKAQQFAGANTTADAFRKAATDQNLIIKKAENIEKNTYNITGLGISEEIATWAFLNEAGNVSSRIFQIEEDLKDGSGRSKTIYVLPMVSGAKAEGTASVDDVRTQLEAEVRKEKKAEKIVAKIGSAADLQAIATATGQEVKSAAELDFNSFSLADLGREPQVQGKLFGLQPSAVSKPIVGDKGVYVVQVTSFTDATPPADLSATKAEIGQPLKQSADFGVIQALTKAAKVDDERYKTRRY